MTHSLPPDDVPAAEASFDRVLRQKLEVSMGQRFYEACDGVTQTLLMNCDWYVTMRSVAPTLVIACPDQLTNWRVLNRVVAIGRILEQFASSAKIRVCPPVSIGTPFEIRVDELPVYQDTPESGGTRLPEI